MLTKQEATPGTRAIYRFGDTGQATTITGHYDDEKLGLMIKCEQFPGGMPAERYTLDVSAPIIFEQASEIAEVIPEEATPAVTFELAIIDEPSPVKITAALIREKSKPLTDLTITNYLDEKGYEAVKKALSSKAVKTRTAIQKQEAEYLKTMKTRHAAEIKEVTDYTAELYAACKEVEKNLQDKINTFITEKEAERKRLDDIEAERTQGREDQMFKLGMLFNGTGYTGYGKVYTKNSLYNMDKDTFAALVTELEGLQMEQSITGTVAPEPIAPAAPMQTGSARFSGPYAGERPKEMPSVSIREYPTAIYDKTLPDGTRIVLTQGLIESPEPGAKVVNDRVAKSGIYVQVI